MRLAIQQREARERTVRAQEPHGAIRLAPVAVEMQVLGKAPILADRGPARRREELAEVVHVELGEAGEHRPLLGRSTLERHGPGATCRRRSAHVAGAQLEGGIEDVRVGLRDRHARRDDHEAPACREQRPRVLSGARGHETAEVVRRGRLQGQPATQRARQAHVLHAEEHDIDVRGARR